jgi:hypothetical protein
MPVELTNIIFSALGIIITGLASWGTTVLIKWLNTKIKNQELASFATTIATVVGQVVKEVTQTYVQNIKGTDAWTKEAQEKALSMALETAKSELTTEALDYIQTQHGDIDKYLITLIESTLYNLKKQ